MDCKLFTVTDDGTRMGFLAIRLDSDGPVTEEESALLRAWGYWPDHPGGYMLLCDIKFGTPIDAGINVDAGLNDHRWRRGSTEAQAYRKILDNWDALSSGDVVDVEQEREAYWAKDAEAEREEADATAG